MCGRVIQSSGPLRYAIVDGMNVRDSLVHNYSPRWNAAPSQELLVIRVGALLACREYYFLTVPGGSCMCHARPLARLPRFARQKETRI
jgi:hypothetical protein